MSARGIKVGPSEDGSRSDLIGWVLICFLSVGRFSTDLLPITVQSLTVNQILLYLLMAYFSLLTMLHRYERFAVRGATLWILMLSVWGATTFLWSAIPLPSLVKGLTFVLLVLAACYFANRLTAVQIVKGICYGVIASVVLSAILSVLLPGIAGTTEFHDGAWRGMFSQKNVLGRAAMLAIIFIAVWHRIETNPKVRRRMLLAAFFAGFVLVMSRSATSMTGVVLFLIAFPVARAVMLSGKRVRLIALFVGPIVLAILAVVVGDLLDTFLQAIGRDADLTGRVPLWEYVWQRAQDRLLIGYGVDVFFDPQYSATLFAALRWVPEHSHNGILDLLLDAGLIGVMLFVLAFAAAVGLVPAKNKQTYGISVLAVATFLVMILQNITESNLYRSSNLIWIIFVVVAVKLSVVRAESARRHRKPITGYVILPDADLLPSTPRGFQ